MLAVDASILAPALGDDGPNGDSARARLRGESITAPELIDLEITSVFRRLVRVGDLDQRRARLAMDDLMALPLRRISHRHLLDRCWELRSNLTVYDASYVATAELFGVPLLTSDARMSRAPGLTCEVELLG